MGCQLIRIISWTYNSSKIRAIWVSFLMSARANPNKVLGFTHSSFRKRSCYILHTLLKSFSVRNLEYQGYEAFRDSELWYKLITLLSSKTDKAASDSAPGSDTVFFMSISYSCRTAWLKTWSKAYSTNFGDYVFWFLTDSFSFSVSPYFNFFNRTPWARYVDVQQGVESGASSFT